MYAPTFCIREMRTDRMNKKKRFESRNEVVIVRRNEVLCLLWILGVYVVLPA